MEVSTVCRRGLRAKARAPMACKAALRRHRCASQQRPYSSYNHFVSQAEHTGSPSIPPDVETFTLAVKDNIATLDHPTQCASKILSSHKSPYEATIVHQLRARGAVITGKTNMDEFGMGSHSTHSVHGPVRNPLGGDEEVSAGGSSGGSAVAVRLGDAQFALGTDTGGSIRLPAAYTGTVGYKPSYGMLSRHGVVPYANSLDTVGLLAQDAQSIRNLVFEKGLADEHDPHDPTSLPPTSRQRCNRATSRLPSDPGSLTIGIPLEYNIEELDPSIRRVWQLTASELEKQGVKIAPVSLPSTREALCAYYVLAPAEASSNLAKYDGVRYGVRQDGSDKVGETLYSGTRGAGFGEEVRRRILLGTYTLSSEAIDNYFIQAQKVRRLVQRDFDRVFKLANPLYEPQHFDLSDMDASTLLENKRGPAQVDFLLCPTAPTFAPTLKEVQGQSAVDSYVNDVFTVPASLAGLPAVSVPAEVEGSRLPAGLQLIGQYWDDRRLLDVASLLQKLLSQM